MSQDFRKSAHEFVDWIADYFENVEQYPVKSQANPKDILNQLPEKPPLKGEPIDAIFSDFKRIIMPGITHWQHPNFYAYFPANTSTPSILAEMLTAAIAVQGMNWQTSPAATELEQRVTEWMRDALGLPKTFTGVIQDGASLGTLSAILSARESASQFKVNQVGLNTDQAKFRVYCSREAHSSIPKAVRIAGLGDVNLCLIDTDEKQGMLYDDLIAKIQADIKAGCKPLIVIAVLGSTGTVGFDPLEKIAAFCKQHNIWLHVDAAYAGTAMLLPECAEFSKGVEDADSFAFNPHKWMFTNFDCSVYFVKDKETLIRTFSILPEYLKTKEDDRVNNYRDWGIPLGRRFRALKLWFVIRYYGIEGLQTLIRNHIALANELADVIQNESDFALLIPVSLNVICFRYKPGNVNEDKLNRLNNELMEALNQTGKMYLTHTVINGQFTLRLCVAQTSVTRQHVFDSWALIKETARTMAI